MATRLTKKVERTVEITGKVWIVSFIPATPENRFDRVSFRPKGSRRGGPQDFQLPVESARNYAAERAVIAKHRERARLRKLRKQGLR